MFSPTSSTGGFVFYSDVLVCSSDDIFIFEPKEVQFLLFSQSNIADEAAGV
jgi:hypothetical protein